MEEELSPGQQPSDWTLRTMSQLKRHLVSPLFYREDIKAQADHTPCVGAQPVTGTPLHHHDALTLPHHPQEYASCSFWQRSLPRCRQSGSQSPQDSMWAVMAPGL